MTRVSVTGPSCVHSRILRFFNAKFIERWVSERQSTLKLRISENMSLVAWNVHFFDRAAPGGRRRGNTTSLGPKATRIRKIPKFRIFMFCCFPLFTRLFFPLFLSLSPSPKLRSSQNVLFAGRVGLFLYPLWAPRGRTSTRLCPTASSVGGIRNFGVVLVFPKSSVGEPMQEKCSKL